MTEKEHDALVVAVRLLRNDVEPVPKGVAWDCTTGYVYPGKDVRSVTGLCNGGTPATFWLVPEEGSGYGRRGAGWCDDCIKAVLGLV